MLDLTLMAIFSDSIQSPTFKKIYVGDCELLKYEFVTAWCIMKYHFHHNNWNHGNEKNLWGNYMIFNDYFQNNIM